MKIGNAKRDTVSGRARTLAWLVPPVVLGGALRLWGLSGQVLIGDEIHLIYRAALPAWRDVFAFRQADPCIPLAALVHLLLVAGVPVTEVLMRSPAVIAGLATLVLLPLLAQRWVGRPGSLCLAWLLAISPSLIYYSRIARPYILVAVLGSVAAFAFWLWWHRGGTGAAASYLLSGALAIWLHPGCLPFIAAPLAFGVFELAWNRLRGFGPGPRRLSHLLVLAALLGLSIAAWMVPLWRSFSRIVEMKLDQGSPSLRELWRVLQAQAGSRPLPVVILFWGLAAAGLVAVWRRRPELALYGSALVATQWLAIVLVVRPYAVGNPIVLNRYVLVGLPVVLLWVVGGLGALRRLPGRAGRWTASTGAVALLAALMATSPYLADPWLRLGPFAGGVSSVAFYYPAARLGLGQLPAVYRALALQPGERAVAEVPASPATAIGVEPLARQYRRPVILGYGFEWLERPGLALRTLCFSGPEALRRSGARFVVLVFDRPNLKREAAGRAPLGRPRRGRREGPWMTGPARDLDRELRAAWGPPHLVDGRAELWDLARLE